MRRLRRGRRFVARQNREVFEPAGLRLLSPRARGAAGTHAAAPRAEAYAARRLAGD